MIPKPIEKLAKKIGGRMGERAKKEVAENPEQWLMALLLTIQSRIENPAAMLETTVEYSFFEDRLAQAKKLLGKRQT